MGPGSLWLLRHYYFSWVSLERRDRAVSCIGLKLCCQNVGSNSGLARRGACVLEQLNHNCFVLRMGRKAVGPVCCVMHVKITHNTYREREGGLPQCFWIRALSTQHQGGYVRATNLLYYYYYY